MAKGKYAIRAESKASQQLADLIATLRQSLSDKETEVKELRQALHQANMAIKHSEHSKELAESLLSTEKLLAKSELERETYITYLKEIIIAINSQIETEIRLPISFHIAAREFGLQHEIMTVTRTQRRNGLTSAKIKSAIERGAEWAS
jgi:uncharacterized UPF0160 family protein